MSDLIQQSVFNKGRLDKFIMVLTLPTALREINSKSDRSNNKIMLDTLQFSVFGTIVPKINVPAIDARYMGSTIQMSSHSHPTYAPITVNFNIDNRFNNYWVIYTWLNILRDQKEGKDGIINTKGVLNNNFNLTDYSSNISVFAVDEYNKPIIKWTYKNAFPTELSEITYNYQSGGEISSTGTFAFHEVNIELLDS